MLLRTLRERCFSMFAKLEREEDKEVNNACKHVFREIVAESKHFGSNLGAVCAILLFKLQTDTGSSVQKMPVNENGADAIPLFFRVLLDFVGKALRIRFLQVQEQTIPATAPDAQKNKNEMRHLLRMPRKPRRGQIRLWRVVATEREELIDGPTTTTANGIVAEIFQHPKFIERCCPDIVQLKKPEKQRPK
jgi:hypothetical protein